MRTVGIIILGQPASKIIIIRRRIRIRIRIINDNNNDNNNTFQDRDFVDSGLLKVSSSTYDIRKC